MNDKYIVTDYSTTVDLAIGLNKMADGGYRPLFMERTNSGYITIVYEKNV